jgi:hypothetical protein
MTFPSHPERANRPTPNEWSPRNFWPWLAFMAAASVGGAILAWSAIPPNSDLFESPLLYSTLGVIAVLCGLAGWFAPIGCSYWGAIPALPYIVAFGAGMADHPADDADLSGIGIIFLLFLLAIPWAIGFSAGMVRRAVR